MSKEDLEQITRSGFERELAKREMRERILERAHGPFWWAYDSHRSRFVQKFSGEELRIVGKLRRESVTDSEWYHFEYLGDNCTYPLAIEVKRRFGFPSFMSKWGRYGLGGRDWQIWRVDHNRSRELWLSSRGLTGDPPYWLWRRADEAIIGAALSLPRIDVLGPPIDLVVTDGGWLNGEWRSNILKQAAMPFSSLVSDIEHMFAADGAPLSPKMFDTWQPQFIQLNRHPFVWSQSEIERPIYDDILMGIAPSRMAKLKCMRETATGAVMRQVRMRGISEEAIGGLGGPINIEGLGIEHGSNLIVMRTFREQNYTKLGNMDVVPGEALILWEPAVVEPTSLSVAQRDFLNGYSKPAYDSFPLVQQHQIRLDMPSLASRITQCFPEAILCSRGFGEVSGVPMQIFGDVAEVMTWSTLGGWCNGMISFRLRPDLPKQPKELSWSTFFQ